MGRDRYGGYPAGRKTPKEIKPPPRSVNSRRKKCDCTDLQEPGTTDKPGSTE